MHGTLMSASQLATLEIRELLESGRLAPGSRISPEHLAEVIQVSRTPVRDALRNLETEGLVEVLPRRGVFVRTITKDEIRDVYAIKTAVEPLAAARAADRGTEDGRERLAALQSQLEDVAARQDVKGSADCVDRIHDQLFRMAGSDVLQAAYRVFHGRVRLLRHLNMAQPGRLATSVGQHRQVVHHVVAEEAEAARRTMYDHMIDASASVEYIDI